MKGKNVLILFGVFVVLLALIYFFDVQGTKKREERQEYEKLLFKVEKDSVVEYTLKNEKDTLTCRKVDGKWNIVSPFFAEGDSKTIESNLNSILGRKIERKVVDKLTDLEPYGLHKPRGEVIVTCRDSSTIRLFVGSENPTGLYVFVKYPDKPDIYTTGKSLWNYVNKSVYDLRDKKIMHVDKDKVKKIELTSKAYGRVVLEKEGEDWYIREPIEYRARNSTVKTFLNSLTGNRAKEFVEEDPKSLKKYGLDNPSVRVDCYVGDELVRATLFIGDSIPDKKGRFYGKEESRKPVFTIERYIVRNLRKNAFYFQEKKISGYDGENADSIVSVVKGEKFVCKKVSDGEWKIIWPDTMEVEKSRINNWLNGIRDFIVDNLVTYEPKGFKKYGLDKPQVKVEIYNNGEKVGALLVGKKEDDRYYVRNEKYPFVYKAREYKVKRIMKKIDDLKKKEKGESSKAKDS